MGYLTTVNQDKKPAFFVFLPYTLFGSLFNVICKIRINKIAKIVLKLLVVLVNICYTNYVAYNLSMI